MCYILEMLMRMEETSAVSPSNEAIEEKKRLTTKVTAVNINHSLQIEF